MGSTDRTRRDVRLLSPGSWKECRGRWNPFFSGSGLTGGQRIVALPASRRAMAPAASARS